MLPGFGNEGRNSSPRLDFGDPVAEQQVLDQLAFGRAPFDKRPEFTTRAQRTEIVARGRFMITASPSMISETTEGELGRSS